MSEDAEPSRRGGRSGVGLRGLALPGLLGMLVLATSPPARTELLRCLGPDGKMIYTDNKALCPGAEPFEPDGELLREERVGEVGDAGPAARSGSDALAERLRRAQEREAAFEAQQAEAERWRRKKQELEADIEKLRQTREHLEKFITNCNRGGLTYRRDAAGIKRTVKCDDIKARYATLEDEETAAEEALRALPEQCRKAGCLPGWIR